MSHFKDLSDVSTVVSDTWATGAKGTLHKTSIMAAKAVVSFNILLKIQNTILQSQIL
jgi:hypothetical protein